LHDDRSFALSITHCPWIPARAHSMSLLRTALGVHGDRCDHAVAYHEESQRAPWWLWSENQWRWGAEQSASHVVFLQDDAVAMPRFWEALAAMVSARSRDVISLHCIHPATMTLARKSVRWASTADGLIGLGYVFPTDALRAFLAWRPVHLRSGAAQELSEDSHINVWAVSTDRRILHPIPTVIDHETRIASTNADQTAGRPRVIWSDGDICGWKIEDMLHHKFWGGPCVHLGRQYGKTHWAARMVVPSFDRFYAVETDECPAEYARFFKAG